MDFLRRIMEGLLTNLLSLIIQAAMISVPFIIVAVDTEGQINNYLYVIIALLASALCYIMWKLSRREYPPHKYEISHGHNIYTLIYKSRELAHYERHLEVIPRHNGIKAFINGEFRWSGNSISVHIKQSADFLIAITKSIAGCVEYIVTPQKPVRAYKPLLYTVCAELKDEKHEAFPNNYVYIKRPTKGITLILKMPIDIPIKNVRFIGKTKIGDEISLIHEEGHFVQEDGYNTYTFEVRRPKITCEYEIRWDWI